MIGRSNAVGGGSNKYKFTYCGGAEAITGKIPASSGFSKYSFNYTSIKGELIQLSNPSAQQVEDVCKNSVVICAYNSMGSTGRTISSGGFKIGNLIGLSEEAQNQFGGDAADIFFVTENFEIT